MSIWSIIQDIILFFKSSSEEKLQKQNFSSTNNKFIQTLLLSLKCYVILFIVLLMLSFFLAPFKVFELVPPRPVLDEYPLLLIMLVAPFYEEIMFRLPLIFDKKYIIISISIAILFLNKHDLIFAIILLVVFISISTFLLYNKKIKLSNTLEQFWTNHFNIVFYTLCISFGLLHIFNFKEMTTAQAILSPLAAFPQIVMGLFMGYVRIRFNNGLIIAILLHIYQNSITTLWLSI
ncbi:type II CAAX prenyl endopeptidase Rce1 family protein [Dysgonomonas termitidis]|uniref:Type II CAAX prenyl endopeptidase Rce1 family protein n=1 Tax=Dysgonomonas termitidis TaxID=1516126 RepID=A0ABV9KVG5_9BACT